MNWSGVLEPFWQKKPGRQGPVGLDSMNKSQKLPEEHEVGKAEPSGQNVPG